MKHPEFHRRRRQSWSRLTVGAGLVLLSQSFLAWPQTRAQSQAPAVNPERELAMKITGPFTVAAVGDLIELHPVSELSDPSVRGAIRIIQSSDMGFANMEANLVDMEQYPGRVTDHTGPKEAAADIKAMGIKMMTRANNHTTDAGPEVMFSTNHWLDEAGIVHAGAGKDLEDARAAKFLETPKGRVGMVSIFSNGGAGAGGSAAATYRFGDSGGAPGVNELRLTTYHIVKPEQLAELRQILDDAYSHRAEVKNAVPPLPANEPTDRLNFFGAWYKAGADPAGLSYTMNQDDLREILRSIRNGKEWSNFMIVGIHTHEDTTSLVMPFLSEYPADFLVDLAHKAIDNGADMFVGTGIHGLRSIEIYKGKPIFYGLSSFVYQLNQGLVTLDRYRAAKLDPYSTEKTDAELSWEAWANPAQTRLGEDNMESVVAECKYDGGQLAEVRLHPIDLGIDEPLAEKGIPRLASADVAQRILKKLQTISRPYGTTISIEGNVGVIRAAAANSQQESRNGPSGR